MSDVFHKWRPIEDLPENWRELADPEFARLLAEWKSRRDELSGSEALRRFNAELVRELAIETGIIEGLYTIDRGTTESLIKDGLVRARLERGQLSHSATEIHAMLKDHESATESVFDFIKGNREFSTSYIREIHAHLTQNQTSFAGHGVDGRPVAIPMIHGDWKTRPNNPFRPDRLVHEYCPPEHVAAEMDRLVSLFHEHQKYGVPPDVEAAWLHHRFSQIHPFCDGNGRVARLLATLVFVRDGGFPLSISRDKRDDYIDALEVADSGDLSQLSRQFSGIQHAHIEKALSLFDDVIVEELTIEEIIEGIGKKIARHGEVRPLFSSDQAATFAAKGTRAVENFSRKISKSAKGFTADYSDEMFPSIKTGSGDSFDNHFAWSIDVRSNDHAIKIGMLYEHPDNRVSNKLEAVPFIEISSGKKPYCEVFFDRAFRIRSAEPFEERLSGLEEAIEHELKWLLKRAERELDTHA